MPAENWTQIDVLWSIWTFSKAVNVSRFAKDLLLHVAYSDSALSILDRRP